MTVQSEISQSLAWWHESHPHELLTAEQEQALAARMRGPDAADALAARNELVSHNVRLAISEALRPIYHQRGLEFDDLVQAGCNGLMRAADKFDPARRLKFSTYATYWVRQAITRAIVDQGTTVRIPVHMDARITRVKQTANALLAGDGHDPADTTVAAELKLSTQQVRDAYRAARVRSPFGLDTPRVPSGQAGVPDPDFSFGNVTPDPDADVYTEVERRETAAIIARVLSRLPERHALIIRASFGLETGEPQTLDAIGRRLGLTRERVRQLRNEAIEQLRESAAIGALRDAA